MRSKFWLESLKERDQSEDIGIGGTIILKWISKNQGARLCIGYMSLKIGTSENSNQPSGSS
jgi:hypothetical protein